MQPSLETVAALTQIGQPVEAAAMLHDMIDREIGFYNEDAEARFQFLRLRIDGMSDAQVIERQDMENDMINAEDDLQNLVARFDQGITLDELRPVYTELVAVTRGHIQRFPELERENQTLRRQNFERLFNDWENPAQEGGLDVPSAD